MIEQYTPWFPPSERPMRDGVYQVKTYPYDPRVFVPRFSYWSGRRGCWGPAYFSAYKAAGMAGVYGKQDRHWRGLTLEAAYPWPMVHTSGCGRTAFRYAVKPVAGDVVSSLRAVTHDGKAVEPFSNPVCPHCGGPMLIRDLSLGAINVAYEAERR